MTSTSTKPRAATWTKTSKTEWDVRYAGYTFLAAKRDGTWHLFQPAAEAEGDLTLVLRDVSNTLRGTWNEVTEWFKRGGHLDLDQVTVASEDLSYLVTAVKAHAAEHYNDGGWDVIVETYDDEAIADTLRNAGARTVDDAISAFAPVVSIYAEREADAAISAGEPLEQPADPADTCPVCGQSGNDKCVTKTGKAVKENGGFHRQRPGH